MDKLKRSKSYPFVLLGVTIAGIALGIWLIFSVIVPAVRSIFGGDQQEALPTPTPVEMVDLTDKIEEILLTSTSKNVSKPSVVGDTVIFASGGDTGKGAQMTGITLYDRLADKSEKIEGISLQNDNILTMAANANYIVYIDSINSGGGSLYCYNRQTAELKELKKIDYGYPEIKICGDYAVWTERTGQVTEKLYMMNLVSEELTTLEVFEDSPMGLSQAGVAADEIVWSAPDPERPENNNYSILKILSLDTGEITEYRPDMYVYNPVTNGEARAWTDANGGSESTLYFSLNGTSPKVIAQNVSGYGMAENFLAYCSQGRIYAYFWSNDKVAKISKDSELAMLMSVSDHAVTWLDITDETRERDILKYMIVD